MSGLGVKNNNADEETPPKEVERVQLGKEEKKGLIVFSPLAQGLLTERYIDGIPSDSRVITDGRFLNEKSISGEVMEKVMKLSEIAKRRGQTLAQMALSWICSKNGVTSVLIGASKPQQIIENVKMLENTSFSDSELKEIDTIVL